MIKRLQINLPFTKAMEQMPRYAKFMKDLLTKKRRIEEGETIKLTTMQLFKSPYLQNLGI